MPKGFFSIGFAVFDFLTMDSSLIDLMFAMGVPPEGQDSPQGLPLGMCMIYAIAMFGLMYALMIRPQNQQRKEHEKLVSEIKSGDRVVAAGMVGTIITVKDDSVTLRTGESKIEVVRTSVERVINEGEERASLDLNKK